MTNNTATSTQNFIFHATGREYFKIWIVNIALTIITLGIYAAWARVRTRKYFYQSTELNGVRFDYHANPKSILKGNLLVSTVILTYAITSTYVPLVSALIVLAVVGLLPLLLVKSIRFHLANSSFSNLRFQFQGSIGAAYKALGLALLIMVGCALAVFIVASYTGVKDAMLGLQEPNLFGALLLLVVIFLAFSTVLTAFNRGLRLYVVNNAAFGNASFKSCVTFHQFNNAMMRILLLAMLVSGVIGAIAGILIAMISAGVALVGDGLDAGAAAAQFAENMNEPGGATAMMAMVIIFVIVPLSYLFLFAVSAYVRTAFNNMVWNHAELEGGHRFQSTASPWRAAGIHLTNWLLIIPTLGLFMPFARVRATRYRIRHMSMLPASSLEQIVGVEKDRQKAYGDSFGEALGLDIGL